jgi:acyl-CoA synthetase (AMP-forming)/AMP-acid ligase II
MNLAEAILVDGKNRGLHDDDRPCFRILNNSDDDDIGTKQQQQHQQQAASTVLAYGSAKIALQEHRVWLQERILAVGNGGGGSGSAHGDGDIVIAYLAWNAVDYFVSVLACTAMAVAAQPALLNARWTASEVAATLQTSRPATAAARTVILYGGGNNGDGGAGSLEQTAHQAAKLLTSSNPHHSVQCIALPNFALNRMTPTSIVRNTNQGTIVPLSQRDAFSRTQASHEIAADCCCCRSDDVDDDDAIIVFTSGTTTSGSGSASSKGVRLSHRAVWVQAWAKLQDPCAYSERTQLLCQTVPFFHVGGLSSILAVWLAGGTLVVPAANKHQQRQQQFDPHSVFASVQSTAVNTLVVVPAMVYALRATYHNERQPQQDSSTIKSTDLRAAYPAVELILIGAQSADAATLKFIRQVFPRARVVQTYACTEAASSLTFLDVTAGPVINNTSSGSGSSSSSSAAVGDCVGRPPRHVEVCVLQLEQGSGSSCMECPEVVTKPYTAGIIATRGPHVMNGYWVRDGGQQAKPRSPPQRQSALPSPWMPTNDVGYWDEHGRLYFSGRVTDSIRTGGETVMAQEVERVLGQHPAVLVCAVFGLRDDRFGEVVCCAIVVAAAAQEQHQQLGVRSMRRWCEQCGLAGYKQPRRVFSVKNLPRNSAGKILKYRLVERFGQHQRQVTQATVPSKL